MASGKLRDYKYFPINVLFVEKNEMSVKKFASLLRPTFAIFCRYIANIYSDILRLFKNRSRRARVDQNDIKFVLCMKNWFLGFIIPLLMVM